MARATADPLLQYHQHFTGALRHGTGQQQICHLNQGRVKPSSPLTNHHNFTKWHWNLLLWVFRQKPEANVWRLNANAVLYIRHKLILNASLCKWTLFMENKQKNIYYIMYSIFHYESYLFNVQIFLACIAKPANFALIGLVGSQEICAEVLAVLW